MSKSERYIFFTFRPQINDQSLFEDFLTLFIPFIKSHIEYAYSVENDGTNERHIHTLLKGKYIDKDKFYQKWNKTNGLTKFKKTCKEFTNTDENGFDTKLVPNEENDILHVLGYTMKECGGNRWSSNMPQLKLTEALEYYHAHRRIKAKSDIHRDWIIMKPQTVHAHITKYMKDKGYILPPKTLGIEMASDKYSWVCLTSKQIKLATSELTLSIEKENNMKQPLYGGYSVSQHIVDKHVNDIDESQENYEILYYEMKELLGKERENTIRLEDEIIKLKKKIKN